MTADLVTTWRARAAELRRYGAAPQATALEVAAEELEAALQEAADEALTLAEAAAESGYSQRRLRELIAEGAVPQAGRKGRPRIRRCDLPRRAGRTKTTVYDPVQDAADLLARGAG